MTTKEQVLQLLIEGSNEYISGERIATALGKTRASVWKAIKALQADGYMVDAVTNKGYRLNDENDILSAEIISAGLKSELEVVYLSSVDSTNNEAKRLVSAGHNEAMLIVANEQTAGRGRQGRSFYSPPLTGIYMTIVTHPMSALTDAVSTTTIASVAVCRAIERLTDKKPKIKWVNDVYLNERKICGILTEAVTDFETQTVTSVIVGIGTNIKTIDFPEEVENGGSLQAEVSRAELICAIADEFMAINKGSWDSLLEYYRSHSMLLGRKINFIRNSRVTPATAVAIDEQGGLVVELENGETEILRSGEISIRY